MKKCLFLLAALPVLPIGAVADEDEVIPTPFPKERYTEMATKSPFVLATPAAEPEKAPEPMFTDNMFVKGVGMDFVVVQRAGDDQPIRLWGHEKDLATNIFVKEIKWSERPGFTRVVLEKDGKTGEVGFNENELKAAPPPPPPGPNGTRPPMPVPPGTPQRPNSAAIQSIQKNNAGAIPVPRPSMQTQVNVPRPTAPNTNLSGRYPAPANSGGRFNGTTAPASQPANDANSGRRRIRTINN